MKVVYFLVSLIFITACKTKQVANYNGENISVSDTTFETNDLDKIITPYKTEMELKMNKVIGYTKTDLVKYNPESPLGNFVADVVFESGFEYGINQPNLAINKKNTICLINFGGLRATVNKGDITIGNVYELMPFDNEIVILNVSPSNVKNMLQYLFDKVGQPVSNAVVQMSSDKQRLLIGGKAYNMEKGIYVITSDYLAKGGDKMSFFKESKMTQTGILMRDALLKYVEKNDTLPTFDVEDRIHIIR